MARRAQDKDPVPALEWAAAAIGLLAALALLGILGREAMSGSPDEVPILETRLVAIESTPAGHVVQFEVANRSGQTAAAVQVKGVAGDEESDAEIDYVPGRSQARGGLLFRDDPRGQEIEIRVTGFQEP